jgi:aryl-phospho-beta-D-glucosidase BglC (GH1 family)
VAKYCAAPYVGTVVGIELLNEPNGYYIGPYPSSQFEMVLMDRPLLQQYYANAIPVIQQANSNLSVIVHDAFLSWYDWTYLSNPADNPNAVLDTHHYEGLKKGRTFTHL